MVAMTLSTGVKLRGSNRVLSLDSIATIAPLRAVHQANPLMDCLFLVLPMVSAHITSFDCISTAMWRKNALLFMSLV